LIKQGAKLVESAQDVLEELQWNLAAASAINSGAPQADTSGVDDLFGSESGLLGAMGFDPVSLDALQARTGLDTAALQAQLMSLELQGELNRLPGGLFQRLVEG
jgi:DNA processing protein